MANKKKGEKFTVGGKTFTKEDEMIAKIKQLAGIQNGIYPKKTQ